MKTFEEFKQLTERFNLKAYWRPYSDPEDYEADAAYEDSYDNVITIRRSGKKFDVEIRDDETGDFMFIGTFKSISDIEKHLKKKGADITISDGDFI